MIASWMLYCGGVSLLLGLAALVLEHGFQSLPLPKRWIWMGALLGCVLLAAVPWFRAPPTLTAPVEPLPPVALSGPVISPPLPRSQSSTEPMVPTPPADRSLSIDRLNRPLLFGWALLSGLMLLSLILSHVRLRRHRRSWRDETVEGVSALVSRNLGPAVIGFSRGAIVLPEWVLRLEGKQRLLLVAHEEEHLRAGDPRLIGLALSSLVLMPWNLPLWWLVRRLRLAIEVDCDARVLARYPMPRAYGTLLLEIGRHASLGQLALTFAEPQSSLERRIQAMARPQPSGRARTAAAPLLACLVLIGTAALPSPALRDPFVEESLPSTAGETQHPALRTAARAPEPVAKSRQSVTATPDAPVLLPSGPVAQDTFQARYQPEDVAELVEREFPADLRAAGIEGEATVRFVVDRQGRAQQIEVIAQNRPQFAEAAKRVVEQIQWWPAQVEGRAVESAVPAFPVRFRLTRAPRRPRPEPDHVERLLRAAVERFYPELLRGETARTPYIYLVVNERGDVVRRALDWFRPSTPVIRDAILNKFPDLPRDRNAIPGGAGYSVRAGTSGGKDIEVFWVELKEANSASGPIQWGPYPLEAVTRGRDFPIEAVRQAVQERHPQALTTGLPRGDIVWFLGSATGEVIESGVGSGTDFTRRMQARIDPESWVIATFMNAANGGQVKIFWQVVKEPQPGDEGVISGRVTDQLGNPVAGAQVLFRGRKQGAVTREDGQYKVFNVPPGVYTLVARARNGQLQTTKEVRLEGKAAARADFVLQSR